MDLAVFNAFARELEKTADASAAFRALDRAGQLAGSGMAQRTLARNVPRVGTFGVKTVSGAKKAMVDDVGVANASLVTSHEDDRVIAKRRKTAGEKLDRESLKQTLKDMPIVIGGTALGYGLGKTVAEEAGKRLAKSVQAGAPRPGWLKHAPLAAAGLSSAASYAFGKSREAARRRREEARGKS